MVLVGENGYLHQHTSDSSASFKEEKELMSKTKVLYICFLQKGEGGNEGEHLAIEQVLFTNLTSGQLWPPMGCCATKTIHAETM